MFHENHKLKTQLANLQLVTLSHFTRTTPLLSFNSHLHVTRHTLLSDRVKVLRPT